MNLDKMILHNWTTNLDYLRFKYYGDFESMKWIVDDCVEDMSYIGNSIKDGAPIFVYKFEMGFDMNLLRDFNELNAHLRSLRIRNITKKDLTKKERSLLTFFNFFMNCDENRLIKGVSDFEIKRLTISDQVEDTEY
jgi:hypothetical protein